MPFAKNSELPKGVRNSLPEAAQTLWRGAFNGSLDGECKGDDTCASKIAWSAVEKKYKKDADGKWVARSELVDQFSLVITKAAYDKSSGEMRFSATASDTELDLREQRMSLELFRDFIHRASINAPAPEIFQSSFWRGGMPYMSVSHYPDMDGKAVPGIVQSLYIDGNRLKAKGILFDTPLGRACWRAICESLYSSPPIPEDERVRISIAFLDWKHAHGNMMYERKSLEDVCPACMNNAGDKVYLGGQLVHLAFTRVPCNPRASVEVELSMSAKTQLEDAISIVGEDQAKEIDEEEKKRSAVYEALVTRSETEAEAETVVESISTVTYSNPIVEEVAPREDVTPADKKRASKEYGGGPFADEKNKKYALDTEKHIRAAWSYIHMPKNRKFYSADELKTIEAKIVAAWKKMIDKAGPPEVKKGMIPMNSIFEEENGGEMMGMPEYFPFDGATTFEEAQAFMDASEALNEFYNDWSMFQTLAGNILADQSVTDKVGSMKALVKEFKSRLDKSVQGQVQKMMEIVQKPSHPLDEAVEALKSSFDTASGSKISKDERLQLVQESFASLGEVIKDKMPESEVEVVVEAKSETPVLDVSVLKSAFSEALQPLIQVLQINNEAIRQLQQSDAGVLSVNRTRQSIPTRRSIEPSLVRQSDLSAPKTLSETPKLRDLIERSVGMK